MWPRYLSTIVCHLNFLGIVVMDILVTRNEARSEENKCVQLRYNVQCLLGVVHPRSMKGFQSDQPWCDTCYELRIAEIRNDLKMYIIRWECLEITKLFYLHIGMWCHYTFRMFRNYKTLWMSLMLVRFILKIFIQYIQRLLWHHLTYLPTQIMN